MQYMLWELKLKIKNSTITGISSNSWTLKQHTSK